MLRFLRRNYLSIDPRTLGLLRIGIAGLLLLDLIKRVPVLRLFYVNDGLVPNHRVLWRPPREYMFSYLLAFSSLREVQVAFGLIALVYMCFLVGFRTRLMHVLSWLSLVSLQTRADLLSSGGDFVFGALILWSAFLPLGRRFSIDAVVHSLRYDGDQVQRDTKPVVSLAVLALIMQLAVIYCFNTVNKNGETWRDGTAVYYLVHQERIVTWLGTWAREALPLWVFQALTYLTLVVEGALPLLLLSPWGRPWTRRLAFVCVIGLHTGMALMSNLGLFSPTMMVYALCLIETRDWQLWEAWGRRRPALQLAVADSSSLWGDAARLWQRLDLFERIQVISAPAAEGGGYVQLPDGSRVHGEPGLRKLLFVLPLGLLWVALAQLARPFHAPLVRWLERERDLVGHNLGPFPKPGGQRRGLFWLGELAVLALILVATSQVLVENPSIPEWLQHQQPRAVRAAVGYLRLNQGWSMFAPDAPRDDLWIVVDAITKDGRHVDPWNEIASRVADPSLRTIPARLGQDAAYCDYTARIPDDGNLHEPFRNWILAYHRRTRRPEDRIVRFRAYVIEQQSPAPGETAARDVRARVFLNM